MKQWKHLKQDDGYVLVYVLIVFTILSFVAVSICTTALKNLQAQKAAVTRMEARYEAEGYLQQFIAEVGTGSSEGNKLDSLGAVKDAVEGELSRTVTADFPIKTEVLAWNTNEEGVSVDLHEEDNWVDVKVTALNSKEASSAQIGATLRVYVTVKPHLVDSGVENHPSTPEDESKVTKYTYEATGAITYESYDISYSAGGDA